MESLDFNYIPDTKVNRVYFHLLCDLKMKLLEEGGFISNSKIPQIQIINLKTGEILN